MYFCSSEETPWYGDFVFISFIFDVSNACANWNSGGKRITETNAAPRLAFVKTFDELYTELRAKAATSDPESGTVRLLSGGVHAVGKKVVEEAAEVWMAAEHEGSERTAEEIAQLVYHLQVMMLAADVSLDDVYRRL